MIKKTIILCIFACLFPVFVFSQTTVTLDTALSNSTAYLTSKIPAKTKVVVLNFTSKWPDLSDYIIEELIGYIVNEGALTVVDRQNLESIRKEMDFQLSGEVSDETAQSIGKKLGAQTIISGAITAIGNTYRLRIRAISVQTAQILGMQNVDVAQDGRLAALTGTAYAGPTNAAPSSTARAATTVNPGPSNVSNAEYFNLGAQSLKLTDNFQYGGNYQVCFTEPVLFNGKKIDKGETYTLKITYTADRDLEQSVWVGLVDPSPAAQNWRPLSWPSSQDLCEVGQEIKASKKGETVSVTLTFKTTQKSTSARAAANALVFATRGAGKKGVAGSGKQGPVTLNFTEFVFTKVE